MQAPHHLKAHAIDIRTTMRASHYLEAHAIDVKKMLGALFSKKERRSVVTSPFIQDICLAQVAGVGKAKRKVVSFNDWFSSQEVEEAHIKIYHILDTLVGTATDLRCLEKGNEDVRARLYAYFLDLVFVSADKAVTDVLAKMFATNSDYRFVSDTVSTPSHLFRHEAATAEFTVALAVSGVQRNSKWLHLSPDVALGAIQVKSDTIDYIRNKERLKTSLSIGRFNFDREELKLYGKNKSAFEDYHDRGCFTTVSRDRWLRIRLNGFRPSVITKSSSADMLLRIAKCDWRTHFLAEQGEDFPNLAADLDKLAEKAKKPFKVDKYSVGSALLGDLNTPGFPSNEENYLFLPNRMQGAVIQHLALHMVLECAKRCIHAWMFNK